MEIKYLLNDDNEQVLNFESDESISNFIKNLIENNVKEIKEDDNAKNMIDVIKDIIQKQKDLSQQLNINETNFEEISKK